MEDTLYDAALDAAAIEEDKVEEEPVDNETYSLLYNGQLTDTFLIGPNEITIRTLKIGEELEAALIANKWADTAEAGRALATAIVAACVLRVDGAPLLDQGLGPKDNSIQAKFEHIKSNWHWASVNVIFTRYDMLLNQMYERFNEVKKD